MDISNKLPLYHTDKKNIVRLILFTAGFALVFINFYSPFEVNNWILRAAERFNLHNIYLRSSVAESQAVKQAMFSLLFNMFMHDLKTGNNRSLIFTGFLDKMESFYLQNHSHAELVRDFIAGMTDGFFLRLVPEQISANL